jgi:hypothetical protein
LVYELGHMFGIAAGDGKLTPPDIVRQFVDEYFGLKQSCPAQLVIDNTNIVPVMCCQDMIAGTLVVCNMPIHDHLTGLSMSMHMCITTGQDHTAGSVCTRLTSVMCCFTFSCD